jgi:hypothetical protein
VTTRTLAPQRLSSSTSKTPTAPVATPHVQTKVCAPTRPPVEVARIMVKLGGTVVYGSDGDGGSQPLAETSPMAVRSGAGCVAVD